MTTRTKLSRSRSALRSTSSSGPAELDAADDVGRPGRSGCPAGRGCRCPPAVITASPSAKRPTSGLGDEAAPAGRLPRPRPSSTPVSRASASGIVVVVVVAGGGRRGRRRPRRVVVVGTVVGRRQRRRGGRRSCVGGRGAPPGLRRRGRRRRSAAGDAEHLDLDGVARIGDEHHDARSGSSGVGDLADSPASLTTAMPTSSRRRVPRSISITWSKLVGDWPTTLATTARSRPATRGVERASSSLVLAAERPRAAIWSPRWASSCCCSSLVLVGRDRRSR